MPRVIPSGIIQSMRSIHTYTPLLQPNPPFQPAITQTSCPDPYDLTLSYTEDLHNYFLKNPALDDVSKRGKFFGDLESRTLLMTVGARKFWKSAVDLVALNRRRGRCIARHMFSGDVVAFKHYGTLGLKGLMCDNIEGINPSDFQGYIALKYLFMNTMTRLYGPDWMKMISEDVVMWIQALEDASKGPEQEDLALQHATLLGREGRAWLSIKIATALRFELLGTDSCDWHKIMDFIDHVYTELDIVGKDLHKKHSFFQEWYSHLQKFGDSMMPEAEHMLMEHTKNGYWLVAINEHGILHPYSPNLTRLSPVGRKYTTDDIIDLLQYKCAPYLPRAQRVFMDEGKWSLLGMNFCWPKVLVKL